MSYFPNKLCPWGTTLFVILISTLIKSSVSNSLPKKSSCGLLYNEKDFCGKSLEIKDSNSFANLGETYLTANTFWNATKSFTVEKNCLLTVCNESYFEGNCQEFRKDVKVTPLQFSSLLSVNCTCATECKCSDVHMRRTSCGKAYINRGCNTCNAFYTDLKGSQPIMPDSFKDKLTSIIVRAGCTLKLYEEEDFEEEITTLGNSQKNVIRENWTDSIASYECVCSEESMLPKPKTEKPRSPSSPPYINIPSSADKISSLLDTELGNLNGIGKHPGIVAALRSLKGKRSPRNAYILLVGLTGAGKSSAINLLFDNDNITEVGDTVSTTKSIHEFRIPVPLDHLGIQNSQLRVIDTPGFGDTNGIEQDAKFLASLEVYLKGHKDLSKYIPNVVLVFGKFHDNRFSGTGSKFVKMLRGIDTFRNKITDKKFSNVIFVLSHYMSELANTRRNPGKKLAHFKKVIEDYSLFPKPISIVVAENKAAEQDLPMLNGYYKLPNGDFYPRNLFDKIESVTVNGEDPIGEAIIRAAFSDSDDFKVAQRTFEMVDANNTKVYKYLQQLSSTIFNPENTEVSEMLGRAHKTLDLKLAKQYPDALPYLQRCFNIRNIISKDQVPSSTFEVVKLMREIAQNEATQYLMEKAFGLKAPIFKDNLIAGHGYNIMLDKPVLSSPFKLGDVRSTDIGYLIPKNLKCNLKSVSKGIFDIFSTRAEYLKFRLKSLSVEDAIPAENFEGQVRPGWNVNIFNSNQTEITPTAISAVKEHRTFELILNDRLELTEDFVNIVRNLSKFDATDFENVQMWSTFFKEYGTHVVKSTHGGGSIEISLMSNQTTGLDITEAMTQIIKFTEDITIGRVRNTSFQAAGIHHTLKFYGGDPKFHATDLTSMNLIEAAEVLENWKESLSLNPAILTTDMVLVPISHPAKKIGANYSTEIEKAAKELFNSTLKYQPPNPNDYVPKPRHDLLAESPNYQEFSMLMTKMIENMNEANKQNLQLILSMHNSTIRLMEQMEKSRQEVRPGQPEGVTIVGKPLPPVLQTTERERQLEIEMRNLRGQLIETTLANENKRAYLVNELDKSRRSSSCLKKGTKILMADGSETNVEYIQVGDFVYDENLNPTKVLGVSSEFLMTQNFYGFAENSYFFTDTHLLVGQDDSSGELQMYAKSTKMLFHQNPLMEYLNIKDMKEQFEVLKFDENERNVQLKNVSVFKDTETYPLDTAVYFLQVDNPAGTYIANGFVCRHEVPPLEKWPKTIALLFSIVYCPEAKSIAQVNYTLESLKLFQNIIDGVYDKIETILITEDNIREEKQDEEILLEHFDLEKSVGDIFGNPSFSAFAVGLYARCGPVLARALDLGVNSNTNVGTLQKILREAAVAEISFQLRS